MLKVMENRGPMFRRWLFVEFLGEIFWHIDILPHANNGEIVPVIGSRFCRDCIHYNKHKTNITITITITIPITIPVPIRLSPSPFLSPSPPLSPSSLSIFRDHVHVFKRVSSKATSLFTNPTNSVTAMSSTRLNACLYVRSSTCQHRQNGKRRWGWGWGWDGSADKKSNGDGDGK